MGQSGAIWTINYTRPSWLGKVKNAIWQVCQSNRIHGHLSSFLVSLLIKLTRYVEIDQGDSALYSNELLKCWFNSGAFMEVFCLVGLYNPPFLPKFLNWWHCLCTLRCLWPTELCFCFFFLPISQLKMNRFRIQTSDVNTGLLCFDCRDASPPIRMSRSAF